MITPAEAEDIGEGVAKTVTCCLSSLYRKWKAYLKHRREQKQN